ncbi:hypothetical protein, partial [Mycobacterium tuberculosis]|uniref:hypothetical protein n=1 Tax=Mycobacterium tuberculosis TaxID=1773 RepID=UPI003DAA1DD5
QGEKTDILCVAFHGKQQTVKQVWLSSKETVPILRLHLKLVDKPGQTHTSNNKSFFMRTKFFK